MTLKSAACYFSFETCRDLILSRIRDLIYIDRFYEHFIQDYYDNWHGRFLVFTILLAISARYFCSLATNSEKYFCLLISSTANTRKLYEYQSRLCNHLIILSVAVRFHNLTEKKDSYNYYFIYKMTDERFKGN